MSNDQQALKTQMPVWRTFNMILSSLFNFRRTYRVPLELSDVSQVSILHEEHYKEDDHDIFLEAKE
jgi:hypothetical protein